MGRASLVVTMLALGGCYAPTPQPGAPCSAARHCPSGLVCASDNTCQVSDVAIDALTNGDAVVCGADEAPCIGACAAEPCLTPAHVPTGFGTFASADLATIVLPNVALVTSTGAIGNLRGPNANAATYEVIAGIGFIRRTQPMGPAIAIWVFGDLMIGGRVTASGDAAVLLASASALTITPSGIVDVTANALVPGPGGVAGGPFRSAGGGCGGGGAPAGTGTSGDTGSTEGGAGGGGFGTAGGSGGSGGGSAGIGGAACTTSLEAILVGGSGGGGADQSGTVPGPFGGGGGGAVQLSAMGPLLVEGVITAGGGAGRTPDGNARDGAGGGAGGAVFLEAPAITIAASAGIFANGGGGGSASAGTGSACAGPLAENGKPSLVAAAGSRCAPGFGGNGAAGTTGATGGAGGGAGGGGGGGGGLGRIVLRTLPGRTPMIATPALSPAAMSPGFAVLNTLD